MSPSETAKEGPFLEHPREALAYYRAHGVPRVICEEKHMGSRAVLVVCRDEETVRTRFRCSGDELGVCYTRTGRAFFGDSGLERELIARVSGAITKAGLWDDLQTNWICLDAELMPWSAKAQELLRRQYASTAAAGLASLSAASRLLAVDLSNADDEAAGVAWWEELTGRGGEGMVVKPLDWIVRGKKGLVQPAVKCRGREYLRIIYGPEYTAPEHMERLRSRGLGTKRTLALREFALGLEALYRFVEREPLYRVHECVFGVLALESEPVDPRL
jgi:hypothetical protein